MRWTKEQYEEYKRKRKQAGEQSFNPKDYRGAVDWKQSSSNVSSQPSTDEVKLNKTEKAFLLHLRLDNPDGQRYWIGVQNVTLKLAHDCRYTPDFVCIESGKVVVYEVKGFWRDDAKVKIKVAARLFPWIRFIVVQKSAISGWNLIPVLP